MTRFSLRPLLLATVVLPLTPAVAQDATGQDGEDVSQGGNVIVVTAQKIEQRAQDVPITISANTGERIEDLGISDLDELSNYVPGLNIQEQSANNPGIVIRGITSDSGSSQQGPRVTLYYNGVDISRSRGSYQAIYDLDRVEVIKGPQATLFGTASAVGAISLVSAKPEPGFSGELRGGYGNFDQTLLGGHLNAGSDVIAGRIAFEWRTRDGYVENLAASQEEELYSQDQLGVRGSLRFTPNDDLTVDLIGTYDRQRNGGTPFISGTFPTEAGPADPFGPANLGGSPFSEQALGNSQLSLVRDVYDVNLAAEYALTDSMTFTTVNGYREFDSEEVFDADGSAAPFLEFNEIADGWQFSHEGRFAYAGPMWRASFGWNFFTEKGRQNVPFSTEEGLFLQCLTGLFGVPPAGRPFGALPCVAPDGSVPAAGITNIPYRSEFENRGDNQSYSVFADVTYIPTPSLELTAGARLLIEQRKSGYVTDVPDSVLSGAPLIPGQVDTGGRVFEADRSFSAILPRFNVLYRLSPDVNVFATVSKGRRSPVVQLSAANGPTGAVPSLQLVPEEVVWNYEGGLKFSNRTVSGSLGVYYQVYDGFQVSVPQLDADGQPTGAFVTQSVGKASNLGVEAELFVTPTDWLQIFGNVGYIDGGIDEDNAIAPTFSGARFRLQPEWQGAAGFTIDAPVADGIRFFATPSVTYRSRIFFEVPNSALISQGPVTLFNARAGLSFADEMFEVAGFIRNATDEDYLLDAGNTGGAFGVPTFIPAEPRFYGIQLKARFGG
ncbi:TonB-dependent receptor [Qipengyuania sp. MTN3-11]|uniref:TonB-dependent receptor n=1 Tax=Qipengyuania sp. MTN3-11 TaxID=3056557 RepID=UPI0036F2EF8A